MKDITGADYMDAKRVCKHFKTFADMVDLSSK